MTSAFYQAKVASNIAFLKYWGKRDSKLQWPANDSLSMTLSELSSKTRARRIDAHDHRFIFAGQALSRDDQRFAKTFRHLDYLSLMLECRGSLEIQTENNFPTGAGIASSASGLAALTLAAIAAWQDSTDWKVLAARGLTMDRIANMARMGSGSAGRSIFGGYVLWHAGSSPEDQNIEPFRSAKHWALCDTVVLFSKEEKALGSTEAHAHAWSSPLFAPRIAGVPERLTAMQKAIDQKNWSQLGPLLETEALEMHAVIMTAQPAHNYLNQAALAFLVDLRNARIRGELQAYFTIDAGPNIHVIYEEAEQTRVRHWLEARFSQEHLLHDKVGHGPILTRLE